MGNRTIDRMRTARSDRLWRFAGWSILAVVVVAGAVSLVAWLLGADATAGRAFDVLDICVLLGVFWMYRDMGRRTADQAPDRSDVAS